MATANYRTTITLSQSTLNALVGSNYFLYGFRAIQSSDAAAIPLVWLQTRNYANQTQIACSDQYQAYTAQGAISPGNPIAIGFSVPIELGQMLTVQQSTGSGVVTAGQAPDAVSILNATAAPLTCGIAEDLGAVFAPISALPLYGGALQLIVPLQTILLLFSTVPAAPGTAIKTAYGPGILIDLSASDDRQVAFDINTGWSWGAYGWAQSVPAGTNLVPLLTEPSRALAALAAGIEADRAAATA